MKQLLREIEYASNFCFRCKSFDYYNSQEYKDAQRAREGMGILGVRKHIDWLSMISQQADEVEERDKTEVEEILEEINYKIGLKCPMLREANIKIDVDRDLEMPKDEDEALLLLDRFDQILFAECPFSRTHLTSFQSSVKGCTLIALAKLDFALLQKGIDMNKLIDIIGLYCYDRDEHLKKCGYSYSLIQYYLKKNNIALATRELFGIPIDITPAQPISTPKLHEMLSSEKAISLLCRLSEKGYCDKDFNWIDKSQKVIMCQFAYIIGGILGIPDRRRWKPFEDLWEVEGLAKAHYKRCGRPLDQNLHDLFPEYTGF